jgi:N-acetylmuramoyl-L-alanine amidase
MGNSIGPNESDIVHRINDSNNRGADLHIALHSNGGTPDQTIFGPEVWYAAQNGTQPRATKSLELSNDIYDSLFTLYRKEFPSMSKRYGTGVVQYGTGNRRFAEIRTPNPSEANGTPGPIAVPSYVEVAFHDNEPDAKWIVDNMQAIAAAIGNGIIDFLNNNP